MAEPQNKPGGGNYAQRLQVKIKPKNMRGTLRRLWELTQGHRRGFLVILVCSCFASASAILSPYIIGRITENLDLGSPIVYLLLLLGGVYFCDWLARFLQQFLIAGTGQGLIAHIRKKLFEKMKRLPLSYFDKNAHGDLMSRLTNDIDNISTTISDSLTQLLMLLFTIVGVLSVMLSLNVLLTFVSLISVLLVFLLTKIITSRTRKLYRLQQEHLGKMNGEIEEGISGLSMVKAFGREKEMCEQFEAANDACCDVGTRALIWSGYLMPIMNVINNLSFLTVATVSGFMAARSLISLSIVSSFILYSRQLSRPFIDLASIYNTFQTAVAGAERIFEVFDESPEPEDAINAADIAHIRGDICFEHVDFAYDPGKLILQDFHLSVPAGTRVAIVGETGAGKTTIIHLLPRFYDVSKGRILLDGRDIRDYKRRELRNAFGIVLQDAVLFHASALDNIRYGHPEATREEVIAAAKAAGIHAAIERLPQGYDTLLGEGGSVLSQGERQLITIARAMLANAPILILDEATSSVDTVTEQNIRSAMLTMSKGRTSFIIAHRLSTIRDSDLILLLDHGRIAECGTHEELMKLGGQYAGLYKTQTGM